jgi:hypothetical protein
VTRSDGFCGSIRMAARACSAASAAAAGAVTALGSCPSGTGFGGGALGSGLGSAPNLATYAASVCWTSSSASSTPICPRRTMYWISSRQLSTANGAIPAAAPTTLRMTPAIRLPASRLISWARAAISAAVSRWSAPRCPGPRRGVGAEGGASPSASSASSIIGSSAIDRALSCQPAGAAWEPCRTPAAGVVRQLAEPPPSRNAGNYMIFRTLCKT